MNTITITGKVAGLRETEQKMLDELLKVFNNNYESNITKERYYEGKISLDEVNLGIAIPDGMRKLEIGCAWGAKTVDVLAGRSMFDGFVGENGEEANELTDIIRDNNLIAEYPKTCRDELKIGCSFATLSADDKMYWDLPRSTSRNLPYAPRPWVRRWNLLCLHDR